MHSEFKASLEDTMKLYLKKTKQNKNRKQKPNKEEKVNISGLRLRYRVA